MKMQGQTSSGSMSTNDIRVRLAANGLMTDSSGSPAIASKSGMSLMERAGVWMSATDSTGTIRVSAHNVLGSNHDFWPGPLQLSNGIAADSAQWAMVYKVNSTQIQYHLQHYKDVNYTPSQGISTWPGSMNPPYAKVLAPFVDNELNDQVYDPSSGDYPYIQTDEVLFSISNDNYSTHTYSFSNSLGVELHTSIMGFSPEDSDLSRCIMVRYSVFNRSNRNYKNFRFSPVMNFAIGSTMNEYLGTDVLNKAMFAINDTSEATFSNKLVSIGCMALNGRLSSTIYFENTGDPVNGIPVLDTHFLRLMKGVWKNGKQMVYGGNGVDASGSSASYVYPYETDASHGSMMWSDNENYQPGKRYGLMNFDSIELKSGAARNYDLLYFFVEEDSFNIKQIGQECLRIRGVLNTKNLLKSDEIGRKSVQNPLVFPNPVKLGEKLMIRFSPESPASMRIISSEGKEICKLNLDIFDNSVILPNDLSEGMYLLEFETLNTKQYVKLSVSH